MTTDPRPDDALRDHYAAFGRDHGRLRADLLGRLAPRAAAGGRPSTPVYRRWAMRMSVAAVVALAVGAPLYFASTKAEGTTTWADVARAIGSVETARYRSVSTPAHSKTTTTVLTYERADRSRYDLWHSQTPGEPAPPNPDQPEHTAISVPGDWESAGHEITWDRGKVAKIVHSVNYISPRLYPGGRYPHGDRLAMWQGLRNLSPETVLKRGYEEVGGERLLKFEVVSPEPGSHLEAGTLVWVNRKTKHPVVVEPPGRGVPGGTARRYTDIRFNEPLADALFVPPAVPEDLDAHVTWHFEIPGEVLVGDGFTFRVLGHDGKPLVTEKDLDVRPYPKGAVPGQSGEAALTAAGVERLDRYMARNPGAVMTVEIAGEPPLTRRADGRMAPPTARGINPVQFHGSAIQQPPAAASPTTSPTVQTDGNDTPSAETGSRGEPPSTQGAAPAEPTSRARRPRPATTEAEAAAGAREGAGLPLPRGRAALIDRALQLHVREEIVDVVPVSRDQMILASDPGWNHGNVDHVGVADGGVRTLFAWPELDAKLAGHRFVLACYSTKTTVTPDGPPSKLGAYDVLSAWDERTSWDRQPRTADAPAAEFEFDGGNGWLTFDVTPLVRAQLEGGRPSHGLMLRFQRESTPATRGGYAFVSREGAGAHEPRRPLLLVVKP